MVKKIKRIQDSIKDRNDYAISLIDMEVAEECLRRPSIKHISCVLLLITEDGNKVLLNQESGIRIDFGPQFKKDFKGKPGGSSEVLKNYIPKKIIVSEEITGKHAYIAMYNHFGTRYFLANLNRNLIEVNRKMDRAIDFLELSNHSKVKEVRNYVFFQAIELAIHAYLLVSITNCEPFKLRIHKNTLDIIEEKSSDDVAIREMGVLYSRMLKDRPSIYSEKKISNITQKDFRLVKKFINHIKVIIAYQGGGNQVLLK